MPSPPEQVPEGRQRLFTPVSLIDQFSMTIDTRNEQSDLLHACRRPRCEGLVQQFAHSTFYIERDRLSTGHGANLSNPWLEPKWVRAIAWVEERQWAILLCQSLWTRGCAAFSYPMSPRSDQWVRKPQVN